MALMGHRHVKFKIVWISRNKGNFFFMLFISAFQHIRPKYILLSAHCIRKKLNKYLDSQACKKAAKLTYLHAFKTLNQHSKH